MENDLEENKSNKIEKSKERMPSIMSKNIKSESSSLKEDNDENSFEENFPTININENVLSVIYFELLLLFVLLCSNNYIIKGITFVSKEDLKIIDSYFQLEE